MKKRVFLSLITTIVCLAVTNKIWLSYIPVNVSFNAIGNGKTKVEVFLNKHNDNEFKKCKYAAKDFILDNDPQISVDVKRSKHVKKLKIVFSTDNNTDNAQTFILKDFRLYDNEINDLQNFSANYADLKFEKNQLNITTHNQIFEIIYNTPFDIKAKINFDYKFFIIICILSYLLAYKLTSYLADFKYLNNKSRIEIVFLSLFGLILLIPASIIDNDEYSGKENRKLAEKPQFVLNDEINYNYGKNFDLWFSDRFNFRHEFIDLFNKIRFILTYNLYNQNTTFYYSKQNNWAFNTSWEQINDLSSDFPIYLKNIKKLKDFCDKNKIKLYIVIAPVKMEAYPQYYPFKIKYNNNSFSQYINKNMGNNFVVYPLEELKQASKKDFVFPKGDPHWSEYGAFTAYKVLMNNIKKDFPDIKILDEDDFNITKNKLARTDYNGIFNKGHEYTVMNINLDNLNTEYTSYQNKNENEVTIESNDHLLSNNSRFPYGYNKKVYIIGNSFSENLFLFIKYTFRDVRKRRINNPTESVNFKFSRWEKEILEYQPDILIISLNGITSFSQLFGEDK